MASSTKHGYIQPLQIDEGEAIFISYFDWDREENVEIGEVKIATFTKETPLGIDNSFFGSINIIVSQQVLERLIQDKDISVDRKSTRLNSSHVAISYAVFCLKKKKNNIQS